MSPKPLPSAPALAALLALAIACGPAADHGRTADPDPSGVETVIQQVRAHYFGQDFHEGAAVGVAALERWPDNPELAAWTVTNLARADRGAEAVERAEALVDARPDDAWSQIAHAFALGYRGTEFLEQAAEASVRALGLAPALPEAVWVRAFVLHRSSKYDEVRAVIDEHWDRLDRPWAELLAVKGNSYLAERFRDPDKTEPGLEILAEARALDPANVNAHFFAGSVLLGDRRADEALPLLERAAELSPGSAGIASAHWRAIRARQDLDATEKTELVAASARALLDRRGQHPSALRTVASTYQSLGLEAEAAELQDRILTDFGETVDAEWVLADRWRALGRRIHEGEVEDTAAARAELRALYWSFVDRPTHHIPGLAGEAYRALFRDLERDESPDPDLLLRTARGVSENDRMNPHMQPGLAIGLARHRVHLDEARELARAAIDGAEDYISERLDFFDTPGEAADNLDWLMSGGYAALAYVETVAGDLDAAREAIDRALELKPDNPTVQLYAGQLAEAGGDLELAEIHYARGYQYERPRLGDDKPNQKALERIYLERHGSLDGYDAYVATLEERDRERRWQRVAESRLEEPRPAPAIDLEWLDGGRIGADELDGRIVVVNFWGVWCGPCVAEAPQIQQFHERYRDDPDVVFLTINNDDDPDKVRSWMAEHEYDFPVLLDDGFAARTGIRAWPSNWFIDHAGRIVFEHIGASAVVYEEFTWRVEMLRADRDGTAVTVADIAP